MAVLICRRLISPNAERRYLGPQRPGGVEIRRGDVRALLYVIEGGVWLGIRHPMALWHGGLAAVYKG